EIEADELLKDSAKEAIIHYNGGDVSEEDIQQNNIEIEEKALKLTDYRHELIEEYDLEYVEDDESLGNFRELKREEEQSFNYLKAIKMANKMLSLSNQLEKT